MSHRLNRTSWLALLFAGLLSGFIVIVLISEIGGPRDAPSLAPTNEINAPQLKPNPNTGTAQANKPNPNTGTALEAPRFRGHVGVG